MDSLAQFLRKHYGSITSAAEAFDVTEQTVYKWIRETPEATVDITYLTELFPQMDIFIDEALRNYRTHA